MYESFQASLMEFRQGIASLINARFSGIEARLNRIEELEKTIHADLKILDDELTAEKKHERMTVYHEI